MIQLVGEIHFVGHQVGFVVGAPFDVDQPQGVGRDGGESLWLCWGNDVLNVVEHGSRKGDVACGVVGKDAVVAAPSHVGSAIGVGVDIGGKQP